MAAIGRISGDIWLNTPAYAGPPGEDPQDHIQLLDIFKQEDATNPVGNLCWWSVTLTVKKCFLMYRGNILCFTLCLLPLVLALGTTEKSLGPFLHPPFRYLYMLVRSLLIFLFSRWISLSSPSLTPQERCSSPLDMFVTRLSPVCPYFCFTGEPRTGHSTSDVASPVMSERLVWPPRAPFTCCKCLS